MYYDKKVSYKMYKEKGLADTRSNESRGCKGTYIIPVNSRRR